MKVKEWLANLSVEELLELEQLLGLHTTGYTRPDLSRDDERYDLAVRYRQVKAELRRRALMVVDVMKKSTAVTEGDLRENFDPDFVRRIRARCGSYCFEMKIQNFKQIGLKIDENQPRDTIYYKLNRVENTIEGRCGDVSCMVWEFDENPE